MFDFNALSARLDGASSRRICLRRFAHADAWPLFGATKVPAFNSHLLWTPPEDVTSVEGRVRAIVNAAERKELSAVSAMSKDTGAWIGVFRFMHPVARVVPGALEMSVWMHPHFWAGRYSLELSRLCIAVAFELSGVERLIASTMFDNRSACGLMESVGMVRVGVSVRETEAGAQLRVQDFDLERSAFVARSRSAVRRARATPIGTASAVEHA